MFYASTVFSLIFVGLICAQTRFLGDYEEKFRSGTKQYRDERARERADKRLAEEKKAHKEWLAKKKAAKRARQEKERDEEERAARGEFVRSRRERALVYGVEGKGDW